MREPQRLAVLVSGTGRSLENLAAVIARRELPASLELVVSDRPGVRALEHAARLGIPSATIPYDRKEGVEAFSRRIFDSVEQHGCELIVMAGFLRLIRLPDPWLGRLINIHPALLPAFGGKGFYGDRVHQAVLERGVQFTGCTVHFVDNEYDHGPIILQRCIAVQPTDTVESLAVRVFAEEKIALPEALRMVIGGEVRYGGRKG